MRIHQHNTEQILIRSLDVEYIQIDEKRSAYKNNIVQGTDKIFIYQFPDPNQQKVWKVSFLEIYFKFNNSA